jgi:hypothetical protein
VIDAHQLVLALGGEWRGHYGLAPCPVCQPERRLDQRGLSVRNDGGRLLAHCHKSGCKFRDIETAAMMVLRGASSVPSAAHQVANQRRQYEAAQLAKARKLWAQGTAIEGTSGAAYLRSRGITCALPRTLRWVSEAFHKPSETMLSAIVAGVSSGGVHRTFFYAAGVRQV